MKRNYKKRIARIACCGGGLLINLIACPALADTTYNWSGIYAGVHGGGVFSNFSNGGPAGPTGSDSSLMGGVQVGGNWQYQRFVLGGEADASKISLVSHGTGGATYGEDYMATFRGRAGYAIDRFLPYFTAGLGLTDAISKASGQGQDSRLQPGLALGAGVDVAMDGLAGDWARSGRWVGRLEYLHVDVPTEPDSVGTTTVRGGSDNNIVRVGLNYKFY